jgi:hypothetical protein
VTTFTVLALVILIIFLMRRRREGTQEIIVTRESTPHPTPSIHVYGVDPYPFRQWPPVEPDPFSKRSLEDLGQLTIDTRSVSDPVAYTTMMNATPVNQGLSSREPTSYLLTPTQPTTSFAFSSQSNLSPRSEELEEVTIQVAIDRPVSTINGEPPPDYHQVTQQVPHSIRNRPGYF